MFERSLACSFCGKGEKEVAKLVAGPMVYIWEWPGRPHSPERHVERPIEHAV